MLNLFTREISLVALLTLQREYIIFYLLKGSWNSAKWNTNKEAGILLGESKLINETNDFGSIFDILRKILNIHDKLSYESFVSVLWIQIGRPSLGCII